MVGCPRSTYHTPGKQDLRITTRIPSLSVISRTRRGAAGVEPHGVQDLAHVVPCMPPHSPLLLAALAGVADEVAGVEPRHDQLVLEHPSVHLGQSVRVHPLSPRLGDATGFEGQKSIGRAGTWVRRIGGIFWSRNYVVGEPTYYLLS